jgi:hypothetical protein
MRQPLPMIYGMPTMNGSHLLKLSTPAPARSETIFVVFELPPDVASTMVAGINHAGLVALVAETGVHLREHGSSIDLGAGDPTAIGDPGMIGGYGHDARGRPEGFLLRPDNDSDSPTMSR